MKIPPLSPRDAISLAKKSGWQVHPKRRSGDYILVAPDGERFTCRAPGRADRVPLALAKRLHKEGVQTK